MRFAGNYSPAKSSWTIAPKQACASLRIFTIARTSAPSRSLKWKKSCKAGPGRSTRRRSPMPESNDYARQRAEMVEKQLRRRGIEDNCVLGALLAVTRHEFVREEFRTRA